ncbi:MAG: lipase [Gorillibacterium sp.]|nr:lipase [Gorillibacterium sp.]
MRSTRWLWGFVGMAALLSTLLFIGGFIYAIRTAVFPEEGNKVQPALPAPTSALAEDISSSKEINILAIGDSLTRGVGDATGKGYVERVKAGLQSSLGKETYVWNLAISGAKTADLLEQLDHTNTSARMQDYTKQANVILLTIGGNDMFQMGVKDDKSPLNPNEMAFDLDLLKKNMPAALEQLDQILTRISKLNPKARIMYVMFYHPFLDYDTERVGSLFVQAWEGKAFEIANRLGNVTVVPTYDLFQQVPVKYLYTDHFHPNPDGYERIAERVLQALN